MGSDAQSHRTDEAVVGARAQAEARNDITEAVQFGFIGFAAANS